MLHSHLDCVCVESKIDWAPESIQHGQHDESTSWLLEKLIAQPSLDSSITIETKLPTCPRKPPQELQDAKLQQNSHLGDGQKNTSTSQGGVITQSFLQGRSQWIDEPVITGWREPSGKVSATLRLADELFSKWNQSPGGPFDPFFDPLWLETAKTLRDAGLPWYNNNINLPDEIDTSWPFHFKEFERAAVSVKGGKVFCPDATGYVTNWDEGNFYSIRALKQEAFRQCPAHPPILLTDNLETDVAETASHIFGLEWHRVNLDDSQKLISTVRSLTAVGARPIIFAATLANTSGETDNVQAIDLIAREFPLLLHVDACRVFDYLSTATDELRRELGLPRLRLAHSMLNEPGCLVDGEVRASTIVAGGSSAYVFPPPVVALKPPTLGDQSPAVVEYVRGKDGTLSGSRDALGPLMLCLQELRFGTTGFREIYESCARNRMRLADDLRTNGVPCYTNVATLDLIVSITCPTSSAALINLGAKPLGNGNFLITMQPSARSDDMAQALGVMLCHHDKPGSIRRVRNKEVQRESASYPLPKGVFDAVKQKVQNFRIATRLACGYQLNQAPYSALGPAIGPFLNIKIPSKWARVEGAKILERRKRSLGLLTPESQNLFCGSFTTGSTMGNRIGLHMALVQHPGAFVYFSSASHYSVKKMVADCDSLTGRWEPGRVPRHAEIPADEYGRMIPEVLVKQVLADRDECRSHDEVYHFILFANLGTTFVGGRDDLLEIGKQLGRIEAMPSYTHVDGALDLGFFIQGLRLGPPGALCSDDGVHIVQGITLSHHKVFGIMVSGEVMSYCPQATKEFKMLAGAVDPRMVFETWLFEQMYGEDDLVSIWKYCLENATLLRSLLHEIDVATHCNQSSIITLLEHPPQWIIQEFQLAPEGDWVHFVTMPHISPATVGRFVRSVALLHAHCATAYDYVVPSLATCLQTHARLQRLSIKSECTETVLEIAKQAIMKDTHGHGIRDRLGLTHAGHLRTRFIHSAMSFAALDDKGEPLVVFLAETGRDRLIIPSILIVRSSFHGQAHMLQDVAIQLYGHLAKLANVGIQTTRWSYKVLFY